jgi:nitroreductase/NAD-dependent dihydropyrimidine dehydrogenase PreA subunit
MTILTIDKDKCKKDGICAQECPVAIIRLDRDDGHPKMVPGGEPMCLACGHCVAVCPHGAISHKLVPIEACPSIIEDLKVSPEQTVQLLRSRRSVRVYEDRPVEKEEIRRLIEIARYGPTASNVQPLEWLVITKRSEIKTISGLTVNWMRQSLGEQGNSGGAYPYASLIVAAWDAGFDAILRNAPVLVIASAPKEANNGLVDLTIALSYLELAAVSIGLGTCWAGLLQAALRNWPPLREVVGLPEGHIHHYPMMLGYPKFKYFRLPERKEPKITWR